MPVVPAICTSCGNVFAPPSGILLPASATGITIRNSTAPPCLKCGGQTMFVEGTFNVRDGLFEIVAGDEKARKTLLRLGLLLAESVKSGASSTEIARHIEPISPGLAQWLLANVVTRDVVTAIASAVAGALLTHALDQGPRTVNSFHTTVIQNINVAVGANSNDRKRMLDQTIRRLRAAAKKENKSNADTGKGADQ